jgi:hypothetical protein
MSKENAESFHKYWKNKKKEKHDQRRKDSNILSIETILSHINKINLLRMNPRWKTPWEKGEDHNSNVGCYEHNI